MDKNPDEKELLEFLNKGGFILEYRTKEILLSLNVPVKIDQPLAFELVNKDKRERIEIDIHAITKNMHLFIECKKKTEEAWFIAKEVMQKNNLFVVYDENGYKAGCTSNPDFNINAGYSEIALRYRGNKLEFINEKEKERQPIHKAVLQVIKNMEAYIQMIPEGKNRPLNTVIVPIIVTNSDLFFLEFKKEDIDSNGNLTKIHKKEPCQYVAFNFAKRLCSDRDGSQEIKFKNSSNGYFITIFLVNIKSLKEFLENFENRWEDMRNPRF